MTLSQGRADERISELEERLNRGSFDLIGSSASSRAASTGRSVERADESGGLFERHLATLFVALSLLLVRARARSVGIVDTGYSNTRRSHIFSSAFRCIRLVSSSSRVQLSVMDAITVNLSDRSMSERVI